MLNNLTTLNNIEQHIYYRDIYVIQHIMSHSVLFLLKLRTRMFNGLKRSIKGVCDKHMLCNVIHRMNTLDALKNTYLTKQLSIDVVLVLF